MDAAADPSASRYSRGRATPHTSLKSPISRTVSIGRGTEASPPRIADTESPAPEDDRSDDFIMDSGAAVHTTARADVLCKPMPPEEGAVVRTRVGEIHPVRAVGCVRRPGFVVPRVRHAPGLKNGCTAIISVRQLARSGLVVTFESESCVVKEQSTGDLVGAGRLREEDGFYHLDFLIVPEKLSPVS